MTPHNLSVALQAIREFEFKHRRRVFGCTRRHKQFNQLFSDRVPMLSGAVLQKSGIIVTSRVCLPPGGPRDGAELFGGSPLAAASPPDSGRGDLWHRTLRSRSATAPQG